MGKTEEEKQFAHILPDVTVLGYVLAISEKFAKVELFLVS